jgi:hypothetical protein
MALSVEFDDVLHDLFDLRIAWLRNAIGKKRPGPVPAFTKNKVNPVLDRLGTTARQILLRQRGRQEFEASYVSKRQWQVTRKKGWNYHAKKAAFRSWYDREIRSDNCVYVFWSGRKCRYVGRTLNGKGRPSSAFDQRKFSTVTRIDIYSVKSPTAVPRAECLAIDVFDPHNNVYSSSRPKYSRKCPLCSAEKEIRRELKRIFPFRKKRRRRK